MFPPNSVWIEAPMFPMMLRERTTIPRTTPSERTTRWPGRSKVVVTMLRSIIFNILVLPVAHSAIARLQRAVAVGLVILFNDPLEG
jgi:hypothetical protein